MTHDIIRFPDPPVAMRKSLSNRWLKNLRHPGKEQQAQGGKLFIALPDVFATRLIAACALF